MGTSRDTESTLLLTDLYQLTMLHGYFEYGMEETAVFEFFVRDLPPERNFLVAAGLKQALTFLENAAFTGRELGWLRETGRFSDDFVEYLGGLRFTGDVYAMPEGTVFFPNEPILRVSAPIPQAQLMETRLINLLHFQTLIASKAARCVLAAPGKLLVDFGLRRAHGAEAGLLAARASYLAGFTGTSTVLAGERFAIPIFGTMAHSFVEAHDDEVAAFDHFAHAQPENTVLLIDTYDTEACAHKVVELAAALKKEGIHIKAVRLDSGDLAEHAHRVRRILDEGGCPEIGIFSSGNLDEYALHDLVAAGSPIGGFGVGTRMDTSNDAPYLDCAYKLTEYAGRGRRKQSESKVTWPGAKQVFRRYGEHGRMEGDTITLQDDELPGEPLLACVMRGGERVETADGLAQARERTARQLERLPEPLRGLDRAAPYPVDISPRLKALAREVDAEIARQQRG